MPSASGIHYRAYLSGEDTPVILIHGAGGSYLSWPVNIRHLPGCQLYALDLPGHGNSSRDVHSSIEGYCSAVLEWMQVMELERVVLAGHSMGGAIALTLALHEAQRVAGLVLLGSGARMKVNPALLSLASSEETCQQAFELVVRWSFSKHAAPKLVELVLQRMSVTRREVFEADLKACNAFDLSQNLGSIHQPAMVIYGDEDKMVPPASAKPLVNELPGASLLIVPECGHMVMLEKPEVVAGALKRFLGYL